jgi:hydroxymethylglutaryl-CoA lyase
VSGARLFIHEVAPRDGLQIEAVFVPTVQKIGLINELSQTGVTKIEVTSFTSPQAIPALADADAVMRGIARAPAVIYAALVPNLRGAQRALAAGVDELNIVMSASEAHNSANLRMTMGDSLTQFGEIIKAAADKARINASLSTAFGCPFEGEVPAERVLALVAQFAAMGITQVTLCDTTGMANPAQVKLLFDAVLARWPELEVTAHFHDTRGLGLANTLAALQSGVTHFDSSLGGLGGCPFAPGASGNVCTEDLVHMFQAMGYQTGVNLDRLLTVAQQISEIVEHGVPGQLMKSGPATRRYPLPDRAFAQFPIYQPDNA